MKILHYSLLLTACCASALATDGGWIDLFNGKNLDGWMPRGGNAKYTVEDGCIVGTAVPNTTNSFLCTKQTYSNFLFEADFKCDPMLNSGVQFRSECFPEARTLDINGKKINVPANRVHGYQSEIDMDPVKNRWWTSGIYDEARRGWLCPAHGDKAAEAAFTAQGAKISKQNEWNHIRIEAVGASIKLFLNGVPRGTLNDHLTPSGFFGLQVHGIGKDAKKAGMQVRFKNLRIKPMGSAATTSARPTAAIMGAITSATFATTTTIGAPAALNILTDEEKAGGWKLLWDGKTTDGWRSVHSEEFPKHGWTIRDGVLIVHESGGLASTPGSGGDIITRDKYSDFELKADFKITPGANSGIKIFVDPAVNKGTGGASIGLEFQILDDARHPDAKLGRDGNRTMGSLYDLIAPPKDKKVNPMGEWNNAHILSQGRHVTFWLNGVKTLEFERGTPRWRALIAESKFKKWPGFGELPEGHILLQDHGDQVSFRNLKIRVIR